ncbi:unnamed protein product [Caenorhabditis sp. 36 PRJEB53466]|nr:unnamed protein product [Caenorhabditis sp. 36 PRJEB53466]
MMRNQKGDASINTPKRGENPFQTPTSKSSSTGFAIMSVELQPGLPRVVNHQDLAPPAHIPLPKSIRKPFNNKNGGGRTRSGNGNESVNGSPRTPNRSGEGNSRKGMGGFSNPNLHAFQLVSPLPFAMNSVPIRGIKTEHGTVKYPLLLCSQEGTLMISMAAGVIVELCLDRSFRVVCNTDFMAYINATGSVSSILHKYAKIVHGKEHVHCKFLNANDRMAVLGPEGILFSMDSLSEAYLLSSVAESGPSAIALEKPTFPIQNMDYSIQQLYAESEIGTDKMEKCSAIMQKAMYEKKPDGTLVVHINGMVLKSNSETGEVSVEAKPIRLTINSQTLSAQLRSSHIDMAIQDKDKCYVKRGDKRIHTSRSGMVVSDGTCTISMDQYGRILSCS